MLPETDVARVRRWVKSRNDGLSERARSQIVYELDIADRHVTVLECRPPWRADFGPEWTRFPIVRFHYTQVRREWATFCRDRNLKFRRYTPMPPSGQIETLLAAVEADHSGVFWG